MTDKQIKEVFKNGFYCIEPCPEIKELHATLKAKEQKLVKIKQYVEDNEWCLLDDTYKELLQIIEGKENG